MGNMMQMMQGMGGQGGQSQPGMGGVRFSFVFFFFRRLCSTFDNFFSHNNLTHSVFHLLIFLPTYLNF